MKLLHERLREHEYRNKCTGRMFADIIGCEDPACVGCDCSDCTACLLDHFADEIERYYIPLPCDPEGKPWKIGDPVRPLNATSDSHVTGYIYDGEEWYLKYRWAGIDGKRSESAKDCKRPQPKVLDADGVEIKVGDTVYEIRSGKQYKVSRIRESAVDVYYEKDCIHFTNFFAGEELTHKEPDSLEKLRDDMLNEFATLGRHELKGYANRLSAFIERSA